MPHGREVWVVEALRTPIGRYGGALASVRPDDLAALVLRAAIDRAGVPPERVDDVYFGAANGSGEDNRNVARMAVLLAGLPVEVPGTTVNRLCGSSLQAINSAAQAIAFGEADVVVAGGVESMTRAPYVLPKSDDAFGRRQQLFDTVLGWRMINPKMPPQWTISLGETAEEVARRYGVTREAQDAFALESQMRTKRAVEEGRFARELVPVRVEGKGGAHEVIADEHPRPQTTLESLGALKPAFASGGTVTAGNSSGINDGAAALVLVRGRCGKTVRPEAARARRGLRIRGRRAGRYGARSDSGRTKSADAPTLDCLRPRPRRDSTKRLLRKPSPACASWISIAAKTNVNGGAIALGHPLGASGARIATTLLHELTRRGGRYGMATMCIGVGQGIATIFERME